MDIREDIDTLSMFFNVLLVDYNNPIIVLEGPMDSFLIKNSIATCGAGKNIPLELNFYYMYDSDTTGNKKSMEKLNNDHYVFLWDKFKKDIGLPNKNKFKQPVTTSKKTIPNKINTFFFFVNILPTSLK